MSQRLVRVCRNFFPDDSYLVFLVRVEEEDIDSVELLDVSVSLEFLSHLCSDGRNGHVERVHLLDLRGLRLQSDPMFPSLRLITCVECCIPI